MENQQDQSLMETCAEFPASSLKFFSIPHGETKVLGEVQHLILSAWFRAMKVISATFVTRDSFSLLPNVSFECSLAYIENAEDARGASQNLQFRYTTVMMAAG